MTNFLNEGHRQIAKREIWVALWVSAWLTCCVHSVAQLRPPVPQPPSVASRPLALPSPWLPWLPTSRGPGTRRSPVWPLVSSLFPFPLFSQRGCSMDPSSREGGKVEWEHTAGASLPPDSSVLSRWFSAFALASFRPLPTLLLNTFLFFFKWLTILLLKFFSGLPYSLE